MSCFIPFFFRVFSYHVTQVAEGVFTAAAARALCVKLGLDLPIITSALCVVVAVTRGRDLFGVC
jgi:hypothetical protein